MAIKYPGQQSSFDLMLDFAVCTPEEKQCGIGGCISQIYWCDMECNCPDCSDEESCGRNNHNHIYICVTFYIFLCICWFLEVIFYDKEPKPARAMDT